MALESFKVSRKDGKLVPVSSKTATLGLSIKILPLTYGQSQSYDSFGKPVRSWTSEEKARLLTENLVELDGEEVAEVTAQDVLDVEAYTLSDILEQILFSSALHRLYKDSPEGNE
jgi:hypothetical protein